MAQRVGGGTKIGKPQQGEIQELGSDNKIVLNKVEVIKQRIPIQVPDIQIIEEETIKYLPVEEKTTRYDVEEKATIKYNTQEQVTIKYNVEEMETVKYVPREVECEKPVVVERPYEKFVPVHKEVTLLTYKDVEAIREAMDLIPKLIEQVKELKSIKIVEEIHKVPKIQYVPTTIKRVKDTGELIDDAD